MNRPPYRRSDEIAAYTYQAGIYCPACLIETMIADGIAAPAARDMPTDDVLEQCAGGPSTETTTPPTTPANSPNPCSSTGSPPTTSARAATSRSDLTAGRPPQRAAGRRSARVP